MSINDGVSGSTSSHSNKQSVLVIHGIEHMCTSVLYSDCQVFEIPFLELRTTECCPGKNDRKFYERGL